CEVGKSASAHGSRRIEWLCGRSEERGRNGGIVRIERKERVTTASAESNEGKSRRTLTGSHQRPGQAQAKKCPAPVITPAPGTHRASPPIVSSGAGGWPSRHSEPPVVVPSRRNASFRKSRRASTTVSGLESLNSVGLPARKPFLGGSR